MYMHIYVGGIYTYTLIHTVTHTHTHTHTYSFIYLLLYICSGLHKYASH